jgi:hypothetical protein
MLRMSTSGFSNSTTARAGTGSFPACMLLLPKLRPVTISNDEARRDHPYSFRLLANHSIVSSRVHQDTQLVRGRHSPRVAAKTEYERPELRKIGSLQSWSEGFLCRSTVFWRLQNVAWSYPVFLAV